VTGFHDKVGRNVNIRYECSPYKLHVPADERGSLKGVE
jgi:hypothetical protein